MSVDAAHYADYTVIGQSYGSRLSPSGAVEDGWTVRFRDSLTGVSGAVFVTDDYYTPDNIRELIAQQLQTIRAVHSLGQ